MKRLDRPVALADTFPMPWLRTRLTRRSAMLLAPMLGLAGCRATPTPPAAPPPAPAISRPAPTPTPRPAYDPAHPVMLGIDVLEAEGFAPIAGMNIGLLTHAAGVNMRGVSTIDILRRAPGVRLVALFGPENGIDSRYPSGMNYSDRVDARTGLPVHSLYNGVSHRPTKAQLAGIDAVVIDLQDIGSRSYTYVSAMKECMEGCFMNGVQVVVLDRPNPLGGLKVDGPPLDSLWVGYVGDFRVPYVHGLTIGELARMAKDAPGILSIPEAKREAGRLTVVPMRGWRRSMRWPDTKLPWIPTSPFIPDFEAAEGYPMTGLASVRGGFKNGIGTAHPFRGISYHGVHIDALERDLRALNLPGIGFRRVTVPDPKTGKPDVGLYIDITDWDAWQPTELSAYLMRLACQYSARLSGRNPFAGMSLAEQRSFLIYWGSTAFYLDLAQHGARADIEGHLRDWRAHNEIYQLQSQRYWLYR